MLDLSAIPVIDNHCHPVYLAQQMDHLQFRRCFTEASDKSMVEQHMPHTAYYLWILRQMASLLDCGPNEEEVLATRNRKSNDEIIAHFLQAANIDTLILDLGYPPLEQCYTPEHTGELGQCRIAKILRLETHMQQLIVEHDDFDEVGGRLVAAVASAREDGYCGLKSIAAYRTGLHIARWSKDEAVAAFTEARAEAVKQGWVRVRQKQLIDYYLHLAFAKAAELGLPVQFHTGYGDTDSDMRLGNPLHLRDILEAPEYRTMPVVLLHESYLYSQFGAYLAALYPQVYFDLSYTIPFIDKLEMLAFTRQALSITPASKLMFSTDGVYVPEMHGVGAIRGRSIIAQALQDMIDADVIDQEQAYRLGEFVLIGTARTLYRI